MRETSFDFDENLNRFIQIAPIKKQRKVSPGRLSGLSKVETGATTTAVDKNEMTEGALSPKGTSFGRTSRAAEMI